MAAYKRVGEAADRLSCVDAAMGDYNHTTLLSLLVVLLAVTSVHCQYQDDFEPPRLLIPGAVSLGPAPRRQGPRSQARRPQQLDLSEQAPSPRLRSRPAVRRLPVAPPPPPQAEPQFFAPAPVLHQQRQLIQQEDFIPPRPVIEDNDDEYEDDLPSFSPTPTPPPPPPPSPPQRPSTFRPERPAFRPERPALLPTPTPEQNFISPSRQQLRPVQTTHDHEEEEEELHRKPAFTARHKARPTLAPADEPQQYSRQPPTRAQSVVRAPQKNTFTTGKQDGYEKPVRDHQRPRKPVAQVLRRYREDNADGSITWGFENDDGSFKEETIGTDCVTYGKYGYIDPDGTRREYTYSTGVLCDKNKDSETQSSEGYIDYAENKYILPNGDSVDLDKMVKNRARRPVAKQQQQYRN